VFLCSSFQLYIKVSDLVTKVIFVTIYLDLVNFGIIN
jgi:hypothetical protein